MNGKPASQADAAALEDLVELLTGLQETWGEGQLEERFEAIQRDVQALGEPKPLLQSDHDQLRAMVEQLLTPMHQGLVSVQQQLTPDPVTRPWWSWWLWCGGVMLGVGLLGYGVGTWTPTRTQREARLLRQLDSVLVMPGMAKAPKDMLTNIDQVYRQQGVIPPSARRKP